MGVVYEGRDPNLERRVAIKTLRGDSLADPDPHPRCGISGREDPVRKGANAVRRIFCELKPGHA